MKSSELSALISKHEHIYILTHTLPDGDAIGSTLAWGMALRQHGKKVRMFCPGVLPRKYAFLPGAAEIEHDYPAEPPPGINFVLDCGDLERLSYMRHKVEGGGEIVNIDHHATNLYFGNYNLVDISAAATGEIIYLLIREQGFTLDREIGTCLYAAISSDTGSFKYGNTTSRTLQITASLLDLGVDSSMVSQKLFDEYPHSTIHLLRDALTTLQLDETASVAWMNLHEDILDLYNAKAEEMEGFVNYAKNILSVEVGIFFYHTRRGETKVGFRSKNVDVGAIARLLGGGGHPRAAGCTIKEPNNKIAMEIVIEAVKKAVGEKVPVK